MKFYYYCNIFPFLFPFHHGNCCCCYCLFTAVCYDSWPRNERKIYVFNFLCSFHFHFFHSHSRVLAACLVAFRIGWKKNLCNSQNIYKMCKIQLRIMGWCCSLQGELKIKFRIGKIGIWLIYLWRNWCSNVGGNFPKLVRKIDWKL